MRVALFSDVHGNLVGLEALLAELEREPPDRLVCCGDVAQGGPQPRECLDRIRGLGCPVVLGNADAFLLTLDPSGEEEADEERRRTLVEVGEWSAAQLGDDHVAFLRSFETTVELELPGGKRLLAFHGSPRSFDEVLLPETPDLDLRAALAGRNADVFAGGHVHLQWSRRIDGALHVSVGSVGLSYDHDQPEDAFFFNPWAEYVLLTADESAIDVEFRRVPFDAAAVVRATLESGKPDGQRSAAGWRA